MTDHSDLVARLRTYADLKYPLTKGSQAMAFIEAAALIETQAAQLERLRAELAGRDAEIERLEYAVGYLSSCTAATAEGLLHVKSSKRERHRHAEICQMLLAVLNGKHLHKHYRISDQPGVVHRLERVVAKIEESLA